MAVSKALASKWGKIFLFGDSLTQRSFSPEGCWGTLLADFLFRRADVISRGFSGYNSRAGRLILPGLLTEDIVKDIVAVTIFFGANDAASASLDSEQHVPVKEYEENVREMVDHCLSVGIRRDQIILISPPAVDCRAWNDYCIKELKAGVDSRSNKFVEPYSSACCKLSSEMGTSLVDFYTVMRKTENYESYLCDGLHLSKPGSHLLFNQLQPIVTRLMSHFPPMLYPEWSEIENKNLGSARQSLKEKGLI